MHKLKGWIKNIKLKCEHIYLNCTDNIAETFNSGNIKWRLAVIIHYQCICLRHTRQVENQTSQKGAHSLNELVIICVWVDIPPCERSNFTVCSRPLFAAWCRGVPAWRPKDVHKGKDQIEIHNLQNRWIMLIM